MGPIMDTKISQSGSGWLNIYFRVSQVRRHIFMANSKRRMNGLRVSCTFAFCCDSLTEDFHKYFPSSCHIEEQQELKCMIYWRGSTQGTPADEKPHSEMYRKWKLQRTLYRCSLLEQRCCQSTWLWGHNNGLIYGRYSRSKFGIS